MHIIGFRIMFVRFCMKKLIHIPRHFTITLGNVLKFQHEFFQQTGKNPELEDYMEGLNLAQDKALMAVGCLSGYVSLDKQLRDGDDETTVMDLLDSKKISAKNVVFAMTWKDYDPLCARY